SPIRFPLGAAPATAARAAGRVLRFDALATLIERAAAPGTRLVLEGAGGLLVPIGSDGTFAGLAPRIGPPLLVLARNAPGTVNHAALTVEAAHRRQLEVAAVVLNETTPVSDNIPHARELRGLFADVPILGPVPFLANADDDDLADAFEQSAATAAVIDRWFR